MSHLAYTLIITGCLFSAIYNVVSKKLQSGEWMQRSSAMVVLAQGGTSVILFALAAATGGPQIQSGFWFPVIATGTLNIWIMYGGMRARALEDVSLVTPIMATTPAFVILTSLVMLGEYPSRIGWLGIMLIVIGTYVLNISEVREKLEKKLSGHEKMSAWKKALYVWFAPFLALRRSRGVRLAFLAALLSTISLNYDGLTARRANIAFGSAIVFGIAAMGNLVVALKNREFTAIRSSDALKRGLPLALLFAASNYVTNFAYREAIVPYVGTLKRIQIPLTILLAFLFLGEKARIRERAFGGTLMAIGAALLALK